MVTIREDYETYIAPPWVRRTLDQLLASLPHGHLTGVSAIVLTDRARLTKRKDGRRSRHNRGGVALGRYHPRWNGQPAWIELVVDDIVLNMSTSIRTLPVTRDVSFGKVLFHEVGHHLHATIGSAGRDGELSADAWERRLSRMYIQKRYGYLRPLAPLFRVVVPILRAKVRRRRDG